jgi:uncharacterized protein YoxC
MLYIAALIVAVSFAVLVVYLVATLKASQRTLDNVAGTIGDLEKQMNSITKETTELLIKTNELADDVSQKSARLDGIFDGAKGIGQTVKEFNDSLNRVSSGIMRGAAANQEKASQAVKWATAIMDIWKKKNK